MTTFLPRICPSVDDKPLPSTGTAEMFRVFARDLDRVLCGEADVPLVAADGGGEAEEGQVVARVA
ncbi:hypothetical protein ACFVZL_13015, partial [Streptomyces sp. NPDC058320]|uniref:hypothetical protein n=1 Tax=unclassified Streptomyces TaxID=2593676 RepID=UPI003630EB9D